MLPFSVRRLALGLMNSAVAYGQAAAPAAATAAAAPPPSAAELKDAAGRRQQPITRKPVIPAARSPERSTMFRSPTRKPGSPCPTLPTKSDRTRSPSISSGLLVTGFLVMFMQAGFAMVEAGLCRVKNANHTYMMNFFVYGCGLFAYWLIGFAIQMGGAAGNANLGGLNPLSSEHPLTLFGKTWGIFGGAGMFLSGHTYDVGVMVIFLFQMVFMDTALTIVTGACAERWKFLAFAVSSVLMGAFTYPLYANWAWGGGWLSQLGTNVGLGKGYCDFAGSGVVHAVGGITALAVALIIGPRIGKFNRDGSSNAIHRPRHFRRPDRLLHSGLRLVRIQSRQHAGCFRERQSAHRLDRGEHDAGRLHRNIRRHALHVVAERQA